GLRTGGAQARGGDRLLPAATRTLRAVWCPSRFPPLADRPFAIVSLPGSDECPAGVLRLFYVDRRGCCPPLLVGRIPASARVCHSAQRTLAGSTRHRLWLISTRIRALDLSNSIDHLCFGETLYGVSRCYLYTRLHHCRQMAIEDGALPPEEVILQVKRPTVSMRRGDHDRIGCGF